jgi:phage tail sheath protein FI
MGARTLSKDRKELHARYVNVRRVIITLKRWIDARMTWVCFEPNSPRLWLRIQREVAVELTRLWQAGALKGQSAEEAFEMRR